MEVVAIRPKTYAYLANGASKHKKLKEPKNV